MSRLSKLECFQNHVTRLGHAVTDGITSLKSARFDIQQSIWFITPCFDGGAVMKVPSWIRPLIGEKFGQASQALSEDEVFELELRLHMSRLKKAIHKRHGAYSGSRSTRHAAQQLSNRKARELKSRVAKNKRQPLSKRKLLAGYRPSEILDRLDPDRISRWKKIPFRRKSSRQMPTSITLENFNFLDDPLGTLQQIKDLSYLEGTELSAEINFADPYCLDAGAYLVLAEFWPQLAPIFHGGSMKIPVQKVLSAINLDQELGIRFNNVKDLDDVWAFPLQRRRPKNTTQSATAGIRPQAYEVVSDQFCDLVNAWLAVPLDDADAGEDTWELSDDGRSHLNNLIGELLCNAERHSQPQSDDGDWSVAAFMVRRDKADETGKELRCYIAFLSVGQSMAESLAVAAPDVKKYISDYLAKHRQCGLSEATLATVVALQDAVTGDAGATAEKRGGTGLQDVLAFVTDLADVDLNPHAEAKVTIVSGNSCIQLVAPHLIGKRSLSSGRRLQWCNNSNTRDEPPDSRIVSDLRQHFAGTLVSVAFTLDPTYIEGKENEDGDGQPDQS